MSKKKCIKCGEIRDISCFMLRKDTGKCRGSCLDCDKAYFAARAEKLCDKLRSYHKQYYAKNADIIKQRVASWKQDNPGRVKINREKESSKKRSKAADEKKEKLTKYAKIPELGLKECSACKEIKSLDEFYFRKDTNRFRGDCKFCRDNTSKTYATKNKDAVAKYHKIYSKTYRYKNRWVLTDKERKKKKT